MTLAPLATLADETSCHAAPLTWRYGVMAVGVQPAAVTERAMVVEAVRVPLVPVIVTV